MAKETRRERRQREREEGRAKEKCVTQNKQGSALTSLADRQQDTADRLIQPPTKQTTKQQVGFRRIPWERLSVGWGYFVATLGVIGFAIALYSLRPVLNASPSALLDPSDAYSQYFNLSNNGSIAAREIDVFWVTNKIIFSNGDTFLAPTAMPNVSFHANLVDPGGTVSVPVTKFNLAFSTGEQDDVVMTVKDRGDTSYLVFHEKWDGHGRPVLSSEATRTYTAPPGSTVLAPLSADMMMVVRFKQILIPHIQERRFRFIGILDNAKRFVWLQIPLDFAEMADLPGAHKVMYFYPQGLRPPLPR